MNNNFSLKERPCAFLKSQLLFLLICFSFSAFAQNECSKKQLREYRNHAHWVSMMNDSTVNYFQAKIAFEEFWKGKPTPESIMEGEKEEQGEERSLIARILKSEKTYQAEILEYSVEHKKFLHWLRVNAPYVKQDGSIMSQKEKDAMLQQELMNRNSSTPSK
jgi:hypothetical protein